MTPGARDERADGRLLTPTVSGFDIAVVAIIVLSALVAFVRGVVRELFALGSWIVGIVLAFVFTGQLAAALPILADSPVAKHVLAFALILIGVLVVGAFIGHLIARAVRAVGLGFLDRSLGAVFGVARGAAMILLFVLIAGLTALPRSEWWQNAALMPFFVAGALALKPWLPPAWAGRLDYGTGGEPARAGKSAALTPAGDLERCAES